MKGQVSEKKCLKKKKSKMNRYKMNNKEFQMRSKMELFYNNKEDKNKIITNLLSVSLRTIEELGQSRLDGWSNMLIFGDNLSVLKTLLNDSLIAKQVKLIYIDPPIFYQSRI